MWMGEEEILRISIHVNHEGTEFILVQLLNGPLV